MGRKKAVNLFPEYARSKKADVETMSQLVLAAKGDMTMKKFANKCGVNTSTISRIINMKTETVCSDEIILAISQNAVPESGVTLEKLLAANGMVKLVPDVVEEVTDADPNNETKQKDKSISPLSKRVAVVTSQKGNMSHIYKFAMPRFINIADYEKQMVETSRLVILDEIITRGYSVELASPEKSYWPMSKLYYGDYVIKTNALKKYDIDTWIFDCRSYHAGKAAGAYKSLEKLFSLAYLNSPKDAGVKVSVVVDHRDIYQQAVKVYSDIRIRDFFSVILISAQNRCVVDEFCIPRIDGTEKSIFIND